MDVTQTKDGNPRVTRYIYENTDDPGNGRYLGVVLGVIEDCGDASHLNLSQAWAYDSNRNVVRYRDSYQPETGGKAHRHFFYYTSAYGADLLTKMIDPENSDASPSDTGMPSGSCPGLHLHLRFLPQSHSGSHS